MDQQELADRMKAHFKKGRDNFSSFYALLDEVRQQVGNGELAFWCATQLGIPISVIEKTSGILNKIDEEIAKTNLGAAREAEKDRRRNEADAARKAREDAAHKRDKDREEAIRQRELEKAEHEKKLAELKAESARKGAERKKVEDAEKRRKQKQSNANERGSRASAKRRKREVLSKVTDAELSVLVERFKRADDMCSKGIDQWVEGSIAKAMV